MSDLDIYIFSLQLHTLSCTGQGFSLSSETDAVVKCYYNKLNKMASWLRLGPMNECVCMCVNSVKYVIKCIDICVN